MTDAPFVSILILTHNAPDLVSTTLESLRRLTYGLEYEVVVVDNASAPDTVNLITRLKDDGKIDSLVLSNRNTLFAEGNNIAARAATAEATHYCLLNSDIEIKSGDWLSHLLKMHKGGITAFGMVNSPLRVDGYCLLIDADLYKTHELNEGHQWWWAVTQLQAEVLKSGFPVRGYFEHERYLHHFGGGSGDSFKGALGMNVTQDEVIGWFDGLAPEILDSLFMRLARRISKRIRRLKRSVSKRFGGHSTPPSKGG